MVKRTFKKSVKTAVNKAISRYARRKLHYVTSLYWNNGTLYIDGQQQSALSLGDILSGNTSEFQTIGKQYAQVKLRGVLLEAICVGQANGYNYGICLGQANDSITFENVRTQPNVMLLSLYNKNRMYVPISGSFTSTNSIELFTNMKIIPFAQGTLDARYTLRITLYLTFKTNL